MVRSSTYRIGKYDRKIIGDVVKNRIDAQRDMMVEQETSVFNEYTALEEAMKATCDEHNVAVIQRPFYYAFGRQCKKIVKKHGTGSIAVAEATALKNVWVSRGLSGTVLVDIAADAGITIT
jgi:hypothetical protein